MVDSVAAFTDTYLPTVNGVTYTVRTWRERWNRLGRHMQVVFPGADGYDPDDSEFPVPSVGVPFYDGFRLGTPSIPSSLASVDLVHAHTPFAVGLAASRLARRADVPFVASYHTPSAEYARYLAPTRRLRRRIARMASAYERRFYDRADLVLAPSSVARDHVRESIGVSTPVEVVSNGVDCSLFRPVDGQSVRERHDLEGVLIGYTGRHGYEKRLEEVLAAASVLADGADGGDGVLRHINGAGESDDGGGITVVFGGDGPARPVLERRAKELGVDARFLGFLDRDDLPAFYSALDVFAFPSPVETQGLVALESIACGTPVVAPDQGALAETVTDGVTGVHYASGDAHDLARAIAHSLERKEELEKRCLNRRLRLDVDRTMQRLDRIYGLLSS